MPLRYMNAYSYAEVTKTATIQVAYYMQASRRCSGAEALAKREIAHGVYIGWRALVESYPDHASYLLDESRLEALLVP